LSRRGGTAAARRTRVDDARKFGISNRSRLRLAAFGRPQSLARHCRGTRLLDRQDAAAVDAAFRSARLSAFGANQLSACAAKFDQQLHSRPEQEPDVPAATLLEPLGPWNALINAISTYANGTELDRVSARDVSRYDDSGVNWRVVEGYGTVIAAHGAGLPVMLGQPVRLIDRNGRRLRVETAGGAITADRAIVTIPSGLLAEERLLFTPPLPEKTQTAAGLPLGLADKLFLSLAEAEEFDKESRLFGRSDRSDTGVYHFRPFGRPQIEAYFGGRLAAELEAGGDPAFADFAIGELTGLLGSDFAHRVKPLHLHRWGVDPFARGSYSYALPGKADCRGVLAAPVDDRVFFAGEACSRSDYSTAHGAYLTGVAAADQAIAARRGKRSS